MQTVKMHGAAFDGSGRIVNREVPAADAEAYTRAGYAPGFIETEERAEKTAAETAKPAKKKREK